MKKIHEPQPWVNFIENIQLKPISFEDILSVLSLKQSIFIDDIHETTCSYELADKLMKELPDFRLYLEFTSEGLNLLKESMPENINIFKYNNRIQHIFNQDNTQGSYFWDADHKNEEEMINKIQLNEKKIFLLGRDHLRPGNGVHTYAPDTENIVLIYNNLTNLKTTSNFNYMELSKEIEGFEIFEVKNKGLN